MHDTGLVRCVSRIALAVVSSRSRKLDGFEAAKSVE
jgi:hypothetical protein